MIYAAVLINFAIANIRQTNAAIAIPIRSQEYPDLSVLPRRPSDDRIKFLVIDNLAAATLEIIRQWETVAPLQWPSLNNSNWTHVATQLTNVGDFTADFALRAKEITGHVAKKYPGSVTLAPDPIYGYKHIECNRTILKSDDPMLSYLFQFAYRICHTEFKHVRLILNALDLWKNWNRNFSQPISNITNMHPTYDITPTTKDPILNKNISMISAQFYTEIHNATTQLLAQTTLITEQIITFIIASKQTEEENNTNQI